MRLKTQRILAALLSLVLLLALAPAGWADEDGGAGTGGTGTDVIGEGIVKTASQPATGVDLSPHANTININLVPSDKKGTEYETDIVNANIQADLYLVVPAKADEENDTYIYYEFQPKAPFTVELVEDLKSAVVADTDPAKQNDYETMLKKFSPIAQAFTWQVLFNPEAETSGYQYPAQSFSANHSTTISATSLDPGLYLLILRDENLDKNETDTGYVTRMKKAGGGQYNEYGSTEEIIATRAYSNQNEFIFEPQLLAVPTKMYQEKQSYNTGYGEWTNILNITAKPDYKPNTGLLKITKTLTNYMDLSKDGSYPEPATFNFSIVGEDENKTVVYKRDAAITITGEASEKEVITLTDIPIGTVVTVTESYTGAHYTLNTDPQTVTITKPEKTTDADGNSILTAQTVDFSNANNDYHRGGHGIENRFEFDKDTGTWQWKANGETQSTGGVEKQ